MQSMQDEQVAVCEGVKGSIEKVKVPGKFLGSWRITPALVSS